MKYSNNILASVFVILIVMLALDVSQAAKAQEDCRWDGTSPACDGSCRAGESEITRQGSLPGGYPPYYYGPDFGKACATGSKALCCKTPGRSCRWDGTAPFCDGECSPGETQTPAPAGSSGGKACWTGSKVYCCRVETGTGSSALSLDPESALYAAIWDKSRGVAWQARHDLTAERFQKTFNEMAAQDYRLVDISAFSLGGQDRYAGVWEKSKGLAWQARSGLTSAQYQKAFEEFAEEGYRLIDISGYMVGSEDRYAAIWDKSQGSVWQAHHRLASEQFQQKFNTLTSQGYRLAVISGYSIGGKDHYAVIWEKRRGPAWQARVGLGSEQFQKEFNTLTSKGYRLTHISGWRAGSATRYAGIWEKSDGPAWVARYGMSSNDFQKEFEKLAKEGFRLRNVSGYKKLTQP